jgi:hypothetical protein
MSHFAAYSDFVSAERQRTNHKGVIAVLHNEKTVTIYVETTAHEWPKHEEISYAQVVTFEFPDFAQHPEINYTVTYERAHGDKPDASLPKGGSVRVKDGMIFHVTDSGQS